MTTVRYDDATNRSKNLILLLPGILDDSRTFAQEDFIAVARRQGVDANFIAADAHLDYYMAKTVVERLHVDVVGPARAAGYREIWIVGISLGGLGALLYLRDHPGMVERVLLLSPYLGRGRVIEPIRRAGSLAAWEPGPECERQSLCTLWQWLQHYTQDELGRPGGTGVVLGYGSEDEYPEAHGLLADALGHERTLLAAGGHDWDTWRALWQRYLSEHWRHSVAEQ